jgi:hypothetical protein
MWYHMRSLLVYHFLLMRNFGKRMRGPSYWDEFIDSDLSDAPETHLYGFGHQRSHSFGYL